MGSKINRMSQVEAELEIPMGDKGGDWKTISIAQRWMVMNDQFLFQVLVIPIAIWEILMEWNQGGNPQGKKLRIGSTGNAGAGNPAINALWEVIEAKVGKNSIWGSEEVLIKSRNSDRNPGAHVWAYAKR